MGSGVGIYVAYDREGHEVYISRQFYSMVYRDMQRLSDITPTQVRYISQGLHDVLPEYSEDIILLSRLAIIMQKLSNNNSMYQFTSEELDLIAMGLNDCCYVLDDILKDLEECDIPEGRLYRSEIENIAELLSKLK